MQKKTNILVTITVAILLAAVFLIRGTPNEHPNTLATESIPPDENVHIAEAIRLFKEQINARQATDSDTTLRGAHPKHHGCLAARFQVVSNLPAELTSDLFVPGADYPAWIRFSNNGEPAPDSKPDVRGLAIKLFEVPGEKFTGDDKTHDLLLVSHPVFLFKDVKTYVQAFEAFGNDHALRFFFNPLKPQLRSFGIAKEMLKTHTNLLAMRWWSMVPYRFGKDRAVKYAARPCVENSIPRTNYGEGLGENFLAERLQESLTSKSGCYEFMVQFQSDPQNMPIEDPRVEWDETIAPFQPLAIITIPPQEFTQPEQLSYCENLSFNPWRAIEAHQPLGGINRARKEIYTALSTFRRDKNQVPNIEPTAPFY